jgi:hypothetical protein
VCAKRATGGLYAWRAAEERVIQEEGEETTRVEQIPGGNNKNTLHTRLFIY